MINQTRLYVISQILASYAQSIEDDGPGQRLLQNLASEIESMVPCSTLVQEKFVPIVLDYKIKNKAKFDGRIAAVKATRETYSLGLKEAIDVVDSQCKEEIEYHRENRTR